MANELIKSAIQADATISIGAEDNSTNIGKRYLAYSYGFPQSYKQIWYSMSGNYLKKSDYPVTLQVGDYIGGCFYCGGYHYEIWTVIDDDSSWGSDPAYKVDLVQRASSDNPIYLFPREQLSASPTSPANYIYYTLYYWHEDGGEYNDEVIIYDYPECTGIRLSVKYNVSSSTKIYGFYVLANFIEEENQVDMLLLYNRHVYEGDLPVYFSDTWERDYFRFIYNDNVGRTSLNTNYNYAFWKCYDYEGIVDPGCLTNYGYVYATYNAQYDEYYWNLGLAYVNNGYIVNNILQYQISSSNKKILKTGNLMGLYDAAGNLITAGSSLGTNSRFTSYSYDVRTTPPVHPTRTGSSGEGLFYIYKWTSGRYTNYTVTFLRYQSGSWTSLGEVNLRNGSTQNAAAFWVYGTTGSGAHLRYVANDYLLFIGSDGRVWITHGTYAQSRTAPSSKTQVAAIPYKTI